MPEAALAASAKLYRPKLATTLAEGYGLADLRQDAVAGLTVAIVALPLPMAIAVASGVSPDRGLFAAIVGGFLVSALGGSRFQIGGPAGAVIVLVAATVAKFGVDGLMLTVLLSGLMLTLLGALRLGALIRHIPHAVTVGFDLPARLHGRGRAAGELCAAFRPGRRAGAGRLEHGREAGHRAAPA